MESKSNKPGTSNEVSFASDKNINKVASVAHDAVDRLEGAADQATRNIKPAVDGVVDAAHRTVDKASELAGSAADWANEKSASVQVAREKLVDDTCAYIAARPMKSLAIAIVAGIVIGKAVF